MLSLSLPSAQEVEASSLISLLDLYLEDSKQRVAAETLKDYRVCLAPFRQWWLENPNIHNYKLSERVFEDFLTWYIDVYRPPRSTRTTDYMINKTTILIRRFLRWLHTKGAVQQRIMDLCPLHTFETNQGKYYPTVNDLAAMFTSCRGPSRLRNAALLAFLVETGARRTEVANVKVSDLTFSKTLMDFSISKENHGHVHFRIVKNNNKGKRPGRHSVFSHMTALLLKMHLLIGNHCPDDSLFGKSDGGIWYIVRSVGDSADLPQIHPHAFRSMFIDWWIESVGVEGGLMADLALKLQVGHSYRNDVITNHYIDKNNSDKNIRRIRSFYTSPLLHLESRGSWDWSKWIPVMPQLG